MNRIFGGPARQEKVNCRMNVDTNAFLPDKNPDLIIRPIHIRLYRVCFNQFLMGFCGAATDWYGTFPNEALPLANALAAINRRKRSVGFIWYPSGKIVRDICACEFNHGVLKIRQVLVNQGYFKK